MNANCRKCREPFEPTANQLRKHDYLCLSCRRGSDKRWRERRKVGGRPVKSTKMPREYHVAYNAAYYQQPEVKQRRAAQTRLRRADPGETPKMMARQAVRRALESGQLLRQPCFCGRTRVDAHHDDYSRPLDVKWLCRTHHNELHHAKAEGRPS